MEERKEDRRIQYTKMVIKDSLIELMKEKPASKVTITELCERADVNRNTFYKHYNTVRDVLDVIEKDIYDSLFTLLKKDANMEGMLSGVCAILLKNKEICKILVSPNGDFNFMKRLFESVKDFSLRDWENRGLNIDPDLAKVIFDYNFFGSIAVIRSWTETDMKEDPYKIVQIIMHLAHNGIEAFKS